jgi:amidase
MNRRRFLHWSSTAGLVALSARAARAQREPIPHAHPLFRETGASAIEETPSPVPVPPFELEETTIADLQHAMASGRLTAHAIAEQYLARIEAVDKQGPTVNSVIELNPDALAIADALDRERKDKGARGPLHGIPILIKDNIDTADRMKTTAGSLALADAIAPRDAFLVERLRAAGAVILGKTNLSEWANFRADRSTSGWSGRGGQTRHPYALDRNPCGSSSGSGAAVAANFCTAAIGTETDGSIVCPSGICGIVGIKPTVGLISRAGVIPISASQDTAGPMARTVADAAALLTALLGVDPRDSATNATRAHVKPNTDYTKFLDAGGLKGARIGVARKSFGVPPPTERVFKAAIDEMKSQGAVIVDPADIPTAGKFDRAEMQVLLYEFKAGLNAYLASCAPNIQTRTLQALIEFNDKNKDREMPFFGQELFINAQKKGSLKSQEYRKARQDCLRLSRTMGIDAVMTTHRLDAIVAPTNGPAWLTDLVNGDRFTGGSSTPAAVAGYPSITVPIGELHGLPIGLSFIGRAWSESTLIKLAYALEQATKARKSPKFLQSVVA